MTTRLPNPERLGIDRLLAAWKASRLAPGASCVVIDAGSAITVDCVSPQGVFLGGAILPGVALQFESLGRGTDALPTLDHTLSADGPAPDLGIPATDTDSAIRAGVWLGTAAAIEGLIHKAIRSTQPPALAKGKGAASPACQVFLTGGDSGRLSPLLAHPHQRHDNLVLEALLDDGILIDRRQTRG